MSHHLDHLDDPARDSWRRRVVSLARYIFFSFLTTSIMLVLMTIYHYVDHVTSLLKNAIGTKGDDPHKGRDSWRRHVASPRYISFLLFRIILVLTTIYNYIDHGPHYWRTQLAQKETRGQGLVTQTRREPRVHFYFSLSYYTCTDNYLQLNTLWRHYIYRHWRTHSAQGRHEGRDSWRRHVASPRYVSFIFFRIILVLTTIYNCQWHKRRHEGKGSWRRRVASPGYIFISLFLIIHALTTIYS